jgi:hypothetical protein
VGVIIETKKPNNTAEMISLNNLNVKSLQQLIYYYLEERINQNNYHLKHLIITDIYNWFIFSAQDFDRLFFQNKKLCKDFNDFNEKRLSISTKEVFYKQVISKYIAEIEQDLQFLFTYFNLNDYDNIDIDEDKKLIPLYKVLSPEHLLMLPFANDNNSLDKNFYNELLHLIGLVETGKTKKVITRLPENQRCEGSLLEQTIYQLKIYDKLNDLDNIKSFGEDKEEQLFNIALELVITWINRILFLKLLEAQLINYHDKDDNFSFLNYETIKNFNDLDTLFFQVLAKKIAERYSHIPTRLKNLP